MEMAGEAIEAHLASGDLKEAWHALKAWYRHTTGRPMKPSREDMSAVEQEYSALFSARPSPGDPIPVTVSPSPVADQPPDEAEIACAVRRLHNGRAPGPSRIRAEDLKEFLRRAERKDTPDPTAWNSLVLLVQTVFSTGEIPDRMAWGILVFVPKSSGGVRGIGLLEVIWKLCTSIVDARLKASIPIHDSLHGFRSQRGTGTAILELILQMQLSEIQNRPLFLIFLDLKKAYDTLDRERTLEILEKYGVGPNLIRLLRNFWNKLLVVARQSGYHSSPFSVRRGVTQGDVISPTIFNIVVDAVVRYWLQRTSLAASQDTSDQSQLEVSAAYYADDGVLCSHDSDQLQSGLDLFVELFERVGLQTNADKTKAMTCLSNCLHSHLSSAAYKRRFDGGPTYSIRKRRKVQCEKCGKDMQICHLPHHLLHSHNIYHDVSAAGSVAISLGRAPPCYTISMPRHDMHVLCPIDSCPAHVSDRFGLRRHFMFHHPASTLCILEEGLLPKCEFCRMHIPLTSVSTHSLTAICRQGTAYRQKEILLQTARYAREATFSVRNLPLEMVSSFSYLGRPVTTHCDDWTALHKNLAKARTRWALISRVLARERASPKVSAMFYKAAVQTVLLYGCETWSLTSRMLNVLESFHHRVARKLTRRFPYYLRLADIWIYPSISETLEQAGMYTMQEYISRRHQYILPYSETRPILQACLQAGRGSFPNRRFWWDPPYSKMEMEMG
jgi:hypothetical protein